MSDHKPISFHFHPYKQSEGQFAVEKSLNNKKRRYLCGVSSGIKVDGHGERMTDTCIKSFIDQANTGDILLYPDVHGIKASEDIGRLVHGEIRPGGDWYTEYILHDESDGIGPVKAEKINDIWKQINGLPPYRAPKQRGFSIEGYIPDRGIVAMSHDGKRVINEVSLDGVILVPRPAYQDSIANAIYKALNECSPWEHDKIRVSLDSKLSDIVGQKEGEKNYYQKKYAIEDAFNEVIEEIMTDKKSSKDARLNALFDDYKRLMVDLITRSAGVFLTDETADAEGAQGVALSTSKIKILKSIESNFQKLIPIMRRSKKNG